MNDDTEPDVSVRDHGHVRELRVGMVCASVQALDTPITHAYWDALALPLLLLRGCERPRCLMLGVGAGSGARWVRALAPRARIVGVDLSSRVVEVARREFGLDELDVEVRIADAQTFLRDDASHYDLIIEDIFVDRGGAACKPAWLPEPGLELAAARLAPGGVLVSNNIAEAEPAFDILRRLFAHLLCVEILDCDNRVYIGSNAPLSSAALREAIEQHATLSAVAANLTLRDG